MLSSDQQVHVSLQHKFTTLVINLYIHVAHGRKISLTFGSLNEMKLDEDLPCSFISSMNLHPIQEKVVFSTIHDLPLELLVRVFYIATEFRFSNLTLKQAAQILLTICRVSSYWRAIAFSLPELWGRLIDITGFSNEQLRNFLEWSRPSPIETFLDGEFNPQTACSHFVAVQNRFSRVLSELDRISYLVIRRFRLTDDHYEHLQRTAPVLTLFSFESDSVEPLPLPPQLFGEGAPQLQSLHLVSALISFEQVSYPNLRHVTIRDIREPFQPSTRKWLVFLSNHPRLEILELSYAISVRFTEAFEWSPTVILNNLHELTLVDDATPCAYFLPKIKVPNTCRISVCTGLDNNNGVQLLQDAFSTFISNRFDHTLHITLTGTSVSFSNDVGLEGPFTKHKLPYFFFKFQWQSNFEPFEDLNFHQPLLAFLPDHHLTMVDTIRINLPPVDGCCALEDPVLFPMFREWLRQFNSVKHLILEVSAIDTVIDLVDDCSSSDEDESGREESFGSPLVIFPLLEGITLVESNEEELDWCTLISFAEWRKGIQGQIRYLAVPKVEVDNLGWEEASRIAELDIEINLQ